MCHSCDTLCIIALIHSVNRGTVITQLVQYGPALVGLLLALIVWFFGRRAQTSLPTRARVSTALGMVIVLALMIVYWVWSVWPWFYPFGSDDGYLASQFLGFTAPLCLSVVALLFLFPAGRASAPRRSADLAPRTWLTFAPRWLSLVATGVVALVVVVSVSAGLASGPDDDGRYLIFGVEASSSTSGSTTIYGWWFSLPCLVIIAVLLAFALAELAVISRPPLAVDRLSDTQIRTTRVRNVLVVVIGGLLLHLGAILQSLYGTSSLRLGFQSEPAGWVSLGTSFAAIGPALLVASYVTVTVGFAFWFAVALSTIHAPFRRLSGSVRQ